MKQAENALLARAHALYAKRLTGNDYAAMTSCRTNNELFAYIKEHTAFGAHIDRLPSVRLSRARFETAIRQALLNNIASLCRFEKLIGEQLYRYFIIKNEIETVLYCARHLDTDKIPDLFIIPEFYKKEQTVFGETLQEACSFDELSAMLEGTPYKRFTEPLIASPTKAKQAILENSLYNYLYTSAADIVKSKFRGKEREEILDYFRFLSDMTMISAFYRLHNSYSDSMSARGDVYISDVSKFDKKQIKALIDSSSTSEVMDIIRSSHYKKYFSPENTSPMLQQIRSASVKMSVKKLRFSQNPIICMLSYATVAENEVKNITHIIEGIKYNLSPDEISEIIVKGE